MYFGRSIFQSVVERLQSESTAASEEADIAPAKPASFSHQGILSHLDAQNAEVESGDFGIRQYQDYELDDEFVPAVILQDEAPPHAEEPTPPPDKDYSYLSMTSLDAVKGELALEKLTDVEHLQALRRSFARNNHPDRVPQEWRDQATLRMTAANQLIDQAIKNISLMKRLTS